MKSKNKTVTLKDLSTKELLNARFGSILYRNSRDVEGAPYVITVGSRTVAGGERVSVLASYQEICDELATRPHVLSKREGSEQRRLKAKAGK